MIRLQHFATSSYITRIDASYEALNTRSQNVSSLFHHAKTAWKRLPSFTNTCMYEKHGMNTTFSSYTISYTISLLILKYYMYWETGCVYCGSIHHLMWNRIALLKGNILLPCSSIVLMLQHFETSLYIMRIDASLEILNSRLH